jgi:hypothetical protein
MRYLVLLFALAMPIVSWFSQERAFGPDNGTISDRYPTLLVAEGYAFAVWGLIFALDLVFAGWQARGDRGPVIRRIRLPAALGFALTAAWMPVFSQQWFGLALLIIWSSLACLLFAAVTVSRDRSPEAGARAFAWLPLSLHAGWLSLAAFLNTAQVIVAYEWLSTSAQLPWSLVLFGLAAALLLLANRAMRGNVAYALVALWGLLAVYLKQADAPLAGADVAAWTAAGIAVVLAVQTIWLRLRRR